MDYTVLQTYVQDGLIGLFIILAGMIKIPKIELNLWNILAKKLGDALNRDVIAKVDNLQKDFNEHRTIEEQDKARAARYRILVGESNLRRSHGESVYSKEAFDELLRDIDRYNKYCNDHPEFENSKAVMAIDYILDSYADYTKENKFLQ